ncbi:MAG: DNA polymerase III subunit delta' [Rhodospirillaceae bacterium]|nr:DNA polymerase III subunit delta' [Rhodospirillaceae bacterium]MBT7267032.1 DNA polymerase III subunit delta' [Rhodospirillaceae bacterium]
MSDDELEEGPPLPLTNSTLLGQAEAEANFLSSFNSGKLPHAWLLWGPRGIGKATLAYRIARFILTKGGGADDGPGLFGDDLPQTDPSSLATDIDDPVCRRIIAGGHADFLKIERSVDEKTGKRRKEITVDEVRAVGSFLSMTPAEGGWRVVVIDSADEMNANAANAVLKVLEEPPKRALLLLVSHNPGRLLPTIRSRCRRLMLKALSEQTVSDLLVQYDPEMLAEDAAELASIADGSIGRALDLSGEGGLEVYREISGILDSLPRLDIPRLHRLGDKLARDNTGELFERAFELINRWLVTTIRGRASNRNSGLDPWIEVWENTGRLFGQAKGLNLDRKQVILNIFLSIEGAAKN